MSLQETSLIEVESTVAHRVRKAPIFNKNSFMMRSDALVPADAFPGDILSASTKSLAVRNTSKSGPYRLAGKRALDVILVLAAAPFWVPLVLFCAFLVALDGHNPFYLQDRVGLGGRVFRMIKLRSMVPDAQDRLEDHLATNPEARAEWNSTQKLKNDPRITRIGRIIRKTSIDELPQLINVLKGDMSLVGPRPFMTSQVELYKGEGYYRLRPGLTGFWQVSKRNECDFADRVQFDDAYESSVRFTTDLGVLMQTFVVIARGTGY